MRYFAIAAVGTIFIAVAPAQAGPVAPGGLTTIERGGTVLLVQDKKETVTQKVEKKVKHAWKRIAGYKFAVACPAFPPITHKTCTETGKDREAARAKCQSQNTLCAVSDAN